MNPHTIEIHNTEGRGSRVGHNQESSRVGQTEVGKMDLRQYADFTPEATFDSSISTKIPEVVTSREGCNCTKPKDRLADIPNSSNENCIVRTNQQGEITVIHLIIAGVACVFGLITIALLKGVNGVVMASGIAAIVALISGFSGYKMGQKSTQNKEGV